MRQRHLDRLLGFPREKRHFREESSSIAVEEPERGGCGNIDFGVDHEILVGELKARDGSRLPYIPEFSVNVSIGLQTARWSTGLSLSWRESTYSTATETSGMVNPATGQPDARYGRIDDVLLVDWNFHYKVNEHLSLFATVNNLFDEAHLVSRHPHGARAGAPRLVSAGLGLRF